MSTHLKPPVTSNDHIYGDENAPVELVEYGDFQCPYCGEAYPIIKKIQETFGDQIKFVFRNFPLTEIHEHAFAAAAAAESAGKQNKFWEMHDHLFEHQNRLDRQGILQMAEAINLNLAEFETDENSAAVKEKIEDDFESGIRSGVNGTPSFFVNGIKFDGDAENLLDLLMENTA